jgi:hypothetical protein
LLGNPGDCRTQILSIKHTSLSVNRCHLGRHSSNIYAP